MKCIDTVGADRHSDAFRAVTLAFDFLDPKSLPDQGPQGDRRLLGRLPKVDLIILEGEMSVRTSVRPSTKSFFDFNEIWYIHVGTGR